MNSFLRHLPNLVSASRFVLAAAFPVLSPTGRIWLCVLAALSDVLDGAIARRLDVKSPYGNIVDPAADKTFVLVVFLTFIAEDSLMLWEATLIMARDIAVVGSVVVLLFIRKPKVISESTSRIGGKATTVLQFAVFIAVLTTGQSMLALVITTGIISVVAGVDYLYNYYKTAKALQRQPT